MEHGLEGFARSARALNCISKQKGSKGSEPHRGKGRAKWEGSGKKAGARRTGRLGKEKARAEDSGGKKTRARCPIRKGFCWRTMQGRGSAYARRWRFRWHAAERYSA